MVHVLSSTQNLVISRPSFVEIGKPKEMYHKFERVCTAIVLYLNCLVTRSIDTTPGWNASSFVLPPPPSLNATSILSTVSFG